MSDVAHIPQTAASHQRTPSKEHYAAADMLREDPRDTLYQGERSLSLALFFGHMAKKLAHCFQPSLMQVLCNLFPPEQSNLILDLCAVFVHSAFDKQQVPARCSA